MTDLVALRVGGVPEHFNFPWRLAIDDDAFSHLNVIVRYSDFPGGTGAMTRALEAGELDVGLVLTEGAVANALETGTSRLVKIYVDSPLIWGIHVAATSDIQLEPEIRGRRFAISRYGSGSHLIAVVDAAIRGWPTHDMSFVVINSLAGAREALARGEADVFLWEKHMTQPLVDGGEFRRIGQRVVPWPAFAVSARRSFLNAHGKTLKSTLDVVARYARNLKRRQSAASEIAAAYGIQQEDAETWLAGVRWTTGYRRPLAALRTIATTLRAQNLVQPAPFDPDAIWQRI